MNNSLKGPFPKMLLGGRYLRRVENPRGQYPQQQQRQGQQPRQVTQPGFSYDGDRFRFDFFRGLTQ